MDLPVDHAVRMKRAMASLDGLSIGDAFGDQFFLADAELLIQQRRTTAPPWFYTDDTAMAVSIVKLLSERGVIERDRLAELFGSAYHLDPRRKYGATAHSILRAIAEGRDWREVAPAAFDGQGSMGNGGGMRAGPVGAYFATDDPSVIVDQARRSAEVTHANVEGIAGAIAVALAAAWAWQNRGAGARWHVGMLEFVVDYTPDSLTRAGVERALSFEAHCSLITAAAMLGNGSRVTAPDTIPFSIWCASHYLDNYEEALWQTVSALGDRDTTCAIVGSIVAMASAQTIPGAWRQAREVLPET